MASRDAIRACSVLETEHAVWMAPYEVGGLAPMIEVVAANRVEGEQGPGTVTYEGLPLIVMYEGFGDPTNDNLLIQEPAQVRQFCMHFLGETMDAIQGKPVIIFDNVAEFPYRANARTTLRLYYMTATVIAYVHEKGVRCQDAYLIRFPNEDGGEAHLALRNGRLGLYFTSPPQEVAIPFPDPSDLFADFKTLMVNHLEVTGSPELFSNAVKELIMNGVPVGMPVRRPEYGPEGQPAQEDGDEEEEDAEEDYEEGVEVGDDDDGDGEAGDVLAADVLGL